MEFDQHPERHKYDYEEKFYRQLGTLIHDLDRRIHRQRERMNVRGDEIVRSIGSFTNE